MKIIDAHVHIAQCIAGRGASGELRAIGNGRVGYTDGTEFPMIPKELGEDHVPPEKVLEVMDRNDVERAVLLQGDFLGFQTLYSYQAMQKWPDRFLAAAAYDPFCRNRDAIVHYLFEELGFRVVKYECSTGSGLMCDRPAFMLDGDVMEREIAYMDDHQVLCVMDIGALGSESCQIEQLRHTIQRHPDLKFVVCHFLAPKQNMETAMIQALERLALPNVWFDTASLQRNVEPDEPPYRIAQRFLSSAEAVVGCVKILFGTYLPSNLVHYSYWQMLQWISEHPKLSNDQKQMILHDNALALFWG